MLTLDLKFILFREQLKLVDPVFVFLNPGFVPHARMSDLLIEPADKQSTEVNSIMNVGNIDLLPFACMYVT